MIGAVYSPVSGEWNDRTAGSLQCPWSLFNSFRYRHLTAATHEVNGGTLNAGLTMKSCRDRLSLNRSSYKAHTSSNHSSRHLTMTINMLWYSSLIQIDNTKAINFTATVVTCHFHSETHLSTCQYFYIIPSYQPTYGRTRHDRPHTNNAGYIQKLTEIRTSELMRPGVAHNHPTIGLLDWRKRCDELLRLTLLTIVE